MKSIADIMKAAQDMQSRMGDAQAKLDRIEVEGQAGAGLVKARMTAKGKLLRLTIDPSLMSADDREVTEDLIVAAVNDARSKAEAAAQSEMSKLTDGLPLPPGFKLPF
jgi:nucleoid-associated protein EbfC